MRQFSLTWNRDYGIDRRSGWTVTVNGSVVRQFIPLSFALLAAARCWWADWRGRNWWGDVLETR